MNMHTDQAKRILAANDRGGYTVPTDRLYPFQWNWDSAFVAMGFALYDTDRAYRELERLVEGQWADGMIPHIVFHAPSDTYFPGPNVWRTRHAIPTSGITQPPVFAIALRKLHEAAGKDGEARTLPLYE
ncbi:neutral trehalase, partial [Rhizobium leguminosarum]|nr:neutral trehalase [Rhizobium leguminosarum]